MQTDLEALKKLAQLLSEEESSDIVMKRDVSMPETMQQMTPAEAMPETMTLEDTTVEAPIESISPEDEKLKALEKYFK